MFASVVNQGTIWIVSPTENACDHMLSMKENLHESSK